MDLVFRISVTPNGRRGKLNRTVGLCPPSELHGKTLHAKIEEGGTFLLVSLDPFPGSTNKINAKKRGGGWYSGVNSKTDVLELVGRHDAVAKLANGIYRIPIYEAVTRQRESPHVVEEPRKVTVPRLGLRRGDLVRLV